MRTFAAFIAQLRDGKPDAALAVLLAGAQTITGAKTFSVTPVVPDASFAFAKLQDIATARVLGRVTAGTGDIEELTGAQISALLPAASATAQGQVELSTNAEAQAGTDAVRAVTPANLAAVVPGLGQTTQNLTGSRAANTPYTNNTGRVRIAFITVNAAATTGATVVLNGHSVLTTNVLSNLPAQFTVVIPPGMQIQINTASSILSWWELG
ncbi:hypothetical protein [Hydrogenophaga sp.]|uniref:hypothetical protein n=1 Tax=Hydrogenophaga sp. TaxID=1904254 RepID=UPI00261F1A76|nr:hypothetical protein [Hydrogenophaga sp.]